VKRKNDVHNNGEDYLSLIPVVKTNKTNSEEFLQSNLVRSSSDIEIRYYNSGRNITSRPTSILQAKPLKYAKSEKQLPSQQMPCLSSQGESVHYKPLQAKPSLSLSSSMLEVSNKWKLSDDNSNPYNYHTALQSIGVNSYQSNNPEHSHLQKCIENCSLKISSPLQQERRFSLDSSTDSFAKGFYRTQHLVKSGSFDNPLHSPIGAQPLSPLSIDYNGKEQTNFKNQNKGYLKMFPQALFKKKSKKDYA